MARSPSDATTGVTGRDAPSTPPTPERSPTRMQGPTADSGRLSSWPSWNEGHPAPVRRRSCPGRAAGSPATSRARCGSMSAARQRAEGPRLRAAGAAPAAHAEDLAERDQRAKLEQVGRSASCIVIFSLGFDERRDLRARARFRVGRAVPVEQPQPSVGSPCTTRHLRAALPRRAGQGPRASAVVPGRRRHRQLLPILDQLGDEIDDLEDRSSNRADRALLERLFDLKRQLIQVRRVTSPEREMFNVLSNREDKLPSRPRTGCTSATPTTISSA
jgi:hypothetical protein